VPILSKEEIKNILEKCHVIAVVGLSRELGKPSHTVAAYLKGHGYHIVPVNPFADEILGEKSYKSLSEMPVDIKRTIQVVNIFRRVKDVPPIVKEAVMLKDTYGKLRAVWMQEGIVNDSAAAMARKAGLTVVMDRCMMVEYKRLL
jgi:predicted CoA-binding protein